jgi:hypothetical protein
MPRYKPIEVNLSVYSFECLTEKQLRHSAELFEITLAERRVGATDVLLTLDVVTQGLNIPRITARKLNLAHKQR